MRVEFLPKTSLEPRSVLNQQPVSVERVVDPDYLETLTRLRNEHQRKEKEKRQ